jgi:hypothetical protein
MAMTSKDTVTMDIKNGTLKGGDSSPSRLPKMKGGQLRSHQFTPPLTLGRNNERK